MRAVAVLSLLLLVLVSPLYARAVRVEVVNTPLSTNIADTPVPITDEIQHNLHEGEVFFIRGDTTLTSGETFAFAITTDTTLETHMFYGYNTTKGATLRIYEGATYSGGIPSTPFNLDRRSVNPSVSTVVCCVNLVTHGTELVSTTWGSTGNKASGGAAIDELGMPLKTATTYVYVLHSLEADNITNYDGTWIESSD